MYPMNDYIIVSEKQIDTKSGTGVLVRPVSIDVGVFSDEQYTYWIRRRDTILLPDNRYAIKKENIIASNKND